MNASYKNMNSRRSSGSTTAGSERSSHRRHSEHSAAPPPNSPLSNETQQHPSAGHHQQIPKPLKFDKAMNDFKTMFPELDRNVIETVLRSNNGVVQSTIDQLLILQESTIKEQKVLPQLPTYESSEQNNNSHDPPPAYSDIWGVVPAPESDVNAGHAFFPPKNKQKPVVVEKRFVNKSKRWQNVPLVGRLPDDFLSLNIVTKSLATGNNFIPVSSANFSFNNETETASGFSKLPNEDFMTDEELDQFIEDEKLAMFLQNEEFIHELRINEEFVSALREDQKVVGDATAAPHPPTAQTYSGGARPRNPSHAQNDDIVFRQQLKNMGKSTRKKFGKLAKKFSRRKQNRPSMMTGSESTFNLLEDEQEIGEDSNIMGNIDENEEMENDDSYSTMGTVRMHDVASTMPAMEPLRGTVRRRLPVPPPQTPAGAIPPPQAASPEAKYTAPEPIVFYSEDNEFEYKKD